MKHRTQLAPLKIKMVGGIVCLNQYLRYSSRVDALAFLLSTKLCLQCNQCYFVNVCVSACLYLCLYYFSSACL